MIGSCHFQNQLAHLRDLSDARVHVECYLTTELSGGPPPPLCIGEHAIHREHDARHSATSARPDVLLSITLCVLANEVDCSANPGAFALVNRSKQHGQGLQPSRGVYRHARFKHRPAEPDYDLPADLTAIRDQMQLGSSRHRGFALGIVVAAIYASPLPAVAEIFLCKGGDGKSTFQDRPCGESRDGGKPIAPSPPPAAELITHWNSKFHYGIAYPSNWKVETVGPFFEQDAFSVMNDAKDVDISVMAKHFSPENSNRYRSITDLPNAKEELLELIRSNVGGTSVQSGVTQLSNEPALWFTYQFVHKSLDREAWFAAYQLSCLKNDVIFTITAKVSGGSQEQAASNYRRYSPAISRTIATFTLF